MKLDDKFYEAVTKMPTEEKDKILIKLLKKEPAFANELAFKLAASEPIEDRRKAMSEFIAKELKNCDSPFSPLGSLFMTMKDMSGDITRHVKTTKDKFGEVALLLEALYGTVALCEPKMEETTNTKVYRFSIYIVNRLLKVMALTLKLKPEDQEKIKDAFIELGELIDNNQRLKQIAEKAQFNIAWMTQFDIPKDIVKITKEMRENGLLR